MIEIKGITTHGLYENILLEEREKLRKLKKDFKKQKKLVHKYKVLLKERLEFEKCFDEVEF